MVKIVKKSPINLRKSKTLVVLITGLLFAGIATAVIGRSSADGASVRKHGTTNWLADNREGKLDSKSYEVYTEYGKLCVSTRFNTFSLKSDKAAKPHSVYYFTVTAEKNGKSHVVTTSPSYSASNKKRKTCYKAQVGLATIYTVDFVQQSVSKDTYMRGNYDVNGRLR